MNLVLRPMVHISIIYQNKVHFNTKTGASTRATCKTINVMAVGNTYFPTEPTMKVTGKKIVRLVSADWFVQMEIFTKECQLISKPMVKEFTKTSMERTFTRGIGLMIKNMVMERRFWKANTENSYILKNNYLLYKYKGQFRMG